MDEYRAGVLPNRRKAGPVWIGAIDMMTHNTPLEPGLTLSDHAAIRMQQRGITQRMILIALDCGECIHSHDALCVRVTERSLCGTRHAAESDRLRGLCVVLDSSGLIITVKWDYRLRRPGPLRRSNHERWWEVRSARSRRPVAEN
jgi:hypothetical protein